MLLQGALRYESAFSGSQWPLALPSSVRNRRLAKRKGPAGGATGTGTRVPGTYHLPSKMDTRWSQ